MIDGRTIYTSLFSGVFWERHDLVLSDIDRIEVIRGPGASVWGANAVNGIINIITKNTSDTRGASVEARVGTDERIASFRQGGTLDKISTTAFSPSGANMTTTPPRRTPMAMTAGGR